MRRYSILLLLLLATVLTACGAEPTLVPEMLTSTPLPTQLPTPTPIVLPTAIPVPVETKEWGIVRNTGAEVKEEPRTSAKTVETLAALTLVAWQNKLNDQSWFERVGGGWINRTSVTIYANEADARSKLTVAAATTVAVAAATSVAVTAGVASKGLGVSRSSIQSIYEKQGLVFTNSPLNTGEQRVLGKPKTGSTPLTELIGPADNLTGGSITISVPFNDTSKTQQAGVDLVAFARSFAPDWQDSNTWISNNLLKAASGETPTITVGKVRAKIQALIVKDGGVIIFSMEAV